MYILVWQYGLIEQQGGMSGQTATSSLWHRVHWVTRVVDEKGITCDQFGWLVYLPDNNKRSNKKKSQILPSFSRLLPLHLSRSFPRLCPPPCSPSQPDEQLTRQRDRQVERQVIERQKNRKTESKSRSGWMETWWSQICSEPLSTQATLEDYIIRWVSQNPEDYISVCKPRHIQETDCGAACLHPSLPPLPSHPSPNPHLNLSWLCNGVTRGSCYQERKRKSFQQSHLPSTCRRITSSFW